MIISCQIIVDDIQQFHSLESYKRGDDCFVANPIPPHQPVAVKIDPTRLVSIDDDADTWNYTGVLLTLRTPLV
jgi:hypothetical protein